MNFADRPLIYVAGPYTSDPVRNTHDTIKFATRLQAAGKVTCLVPHLSLFWDAITPQDYQYWLEYDLALLARCDALLRLPGESPGSDNEVRFAHEREIPVFYTEEAMLAALGWLGK